LKDVHSVHAGIHLLLDRKDWNKHPGWEEAIAKEASGILEKELPVVPRKAVAEVSKIGNL